MRQIVLDTETTGIGAEAGHRIIEIGCVEIINRKLTGERFHTYLNPQREVDEGAFRVHGISTAFLYDKPLFNDVVNQFLEFVQGSELIIHNAPFDVGFLNAELRQVNRAKSMEDYCSIFDTLVFARQKHPGQRNSLDALCKRYDVDHSNRQLHGALLDAELLACVYLAMTGGQTTLFVDDDFGPVVANHQQDAPVSLFSDAPVYYAAPEELSRHNAFIQALVKKSNLNYWDDEQS